MNNIPINPGLIESPSHVENDPRKARIMEAPCAAEKKPAEFFGFHAVNHIAKYNYSQAQIPCCVAEVGSRYAGILSLKENDIYIKPSVEVLMGYIKKRIENNTGKGAMLESCPKALKEYGVPLEKEYSTDYKTTWEKFISLLRLTDIIEASGTKQRINSYGWTDNDFESHKVAIFNGEGNFVEGGVRGSNEGWKTGEVRPHIRGEKTWGHAIGYFGYDDCIYFVNSWGKWGLTLYLKLVSNEFGKYYIKGNENDYDVIIKGVGKMDKRYEQPDYSGDPNMFRGYTYIDLPDELAQKTKMSKTIRVKGNKRIYEVLKDEKGEDYYCWITSDRAYIAGIINKKWLGWDSVIEVDSIDDEKVIATFNKEY